MSARYYCPQACDSRKGWVDLPSLASTKEKEAERNVLNWREQSPSNNTLQTRVIRKPHGWEP